MFTKPSLKLSSLSTLLFLSCLLIFSTSCREILEEIKDELRGRPAVSLPETVTINEQALYPEGVEFYEKGQFFLVSSLTRGTIGRVLDNGNYRPYIEDEKFVSTIGIQVDQMYDRLLICNSDPNAGNLASLSVYSLPERKEIFFVNLGEAFAPDAPHFANDVDVDEDGNAYVTDSFSPYIYKVDKEGNAEVFLNDEEFATEPGQFGLNGIVYHPHGYLIVAFSATNSLYKIPLDDPHNFSKIELDAELMGPDGLYLSKDAKTLVVVNNAGGVAPGKVLALQSDNEWLNAEQKGEFMTGEVFPTTAVQRGNQFYVLYAYLNELFSGNTALDEYQIQQVKFEE